MNFGCGKIDMSMRCEACGEEVHVAEVIIEKIVEKPVAFIAAIEAGISSLRKWFSFGVPVPDQTTLNCLQAITPVLEQKTRGVIDQTLAAWANAAGYPCPDCKKNQTQCIQMCQAHRVGNQSLRSKTHKMPSIKCKLN